MRIGEFDDAVGKQFLARREVVNGELSRLGARLGEPGHGAVSPAVHVPDSVVLSSEARSAQLAHRLASLPLPPFPSPRQLIAALKQSEAAQGDKQAAEALARLGALVAALARSLPPGAAVPPGGTDLARALVRALLRGSNDPGVAGLVRQLLAASSRPEMSPGAAMPSTTYERAAVAILTALLQVRGEVPLPASVPSGQALPAALLSLLAQPFPRASRARRKSRRRLTDPAGEDDYQRDSGRT